MRELTPDAVAQAERLVRDEGFVLIHSTNNPEILAGAGTIMLEILEQEDDLDAGCNQLPRRTLQTERTVRRREERRSDDAEDDRQYQSGELHPAAHTILIRSLARSHRLG